MSSEAKYKDPVTGDGLTTAEYLSWLVQGIIRRWTFLIVISIVTATVWFLGTTEAREWWNYAASYMAIFIESVVGIAMFAQTRRDAVALREVRALAQRIEDIAEVLLKEVEDIEEYIEDEVATPLPSVPYSEGKEPVEGQKTLQKNE